jgi:biotin carboxylase
MNPKVLLLFEYDWDASGFANQSQHYRFERAGFDLFEFPDNAHLLLFNLDRFVDRLIKRSQSDPFAAVVSNHEQFGALAAALFAQRMQLPGPTAASIVACQHKYVMRELLQEVAPEANIGFELLDCKMGHKPPLQKRFPIFVKPIKAAYSVLARICHNQRELEELVTFSWHEHFIINRLVQPFERISQRLLPGTVSAHRMMIEEPIQAQQFNLDGYMYQGQAYLIGVVDEIMYPDTQAFMRFHYPSALHDSIQSRALAIAQKLLTRAGFDHSFFNMEFFYDAATDRISIIEFNPRLGSQLADLYRRVLGLDIYAMQIALALGRDPKSVPSVTTNQTVAASFVFRSFNGERPSTVLTKANQAALMQAFPDALIMSFEKSDVGLAREYKWLGSHRYGVLHLSGTDLNDLKDRFAQACALLQWPVGPQWDDS